MPRARGCDMMGSVRARQGGGAGMIDREVEEAIDLLVEEYRARCLWSAPTDYLPRSDDERLLALDKIERHGDRSGFIRARELRGWLLQSSRRPSRG